MAFSIKPHIQWVGKIDWELKHFHGEELSTHRGSSYNAYLIQDEKTALIDTVWKPFAQDFVANLKKEIDLHTIDYIISLHGEVDHSGALVELLKEIPDTPIYCTANGVKSLKGQYHGDWNFQVVKTGDTLQLGKRTITFVEAPMLHWPDTMFAYLSDDHILFSSDGFGQHYASESFYNDLVDQAELYQEALKYYANILSPFHKQMQSKLKALADMNLPIEMICPAHGIIWRENPMQIVQAYEKWCHQYTENQVTIVYDSMWHGTSLMAEAVAEGLRTENQNLTIKLFQMGKADESDAITEAFRSKAILLGSPTVNRSVLPTLSCMATRLKAASLQNKIGASFGTYGWSGECVKVLNAYLEEAGISLAHEGIRANWNPDETVLQSCRDLGKIIAQKCREQ